jgi:hypothetical protein
VVSQQQWECLAVREPGEVLRSARASQRSRLIFVSMSVGLIGLLLAVKHAVFDQPGGFNPDSDPQLSIVSFVGFLALLFGWLSWYANRHRRIATAALAEHRGFYAVTFMPTGQGMSLYSTLVLAPDGVWLIPGKRLARNQPTTHIAVAQIVGIRAWSEGRGTRGLQLEILGATGAVLVRGWVLTIFRGQLGIEKMLDRLDQSPSSSSIHDAPPFQNSATSSGADQLANDLVYPAVVLPPPRNYKWIGWKIVVGGFLPLGLLIAGAAQTTQFDSVNNNPNAITVTAIADRVEKNCDKGSCRWDSYGHYAVAGYDVYDAFLAAAGTPALGHYDVRVVPNRPFIIYRVDDDGHEYMATLILGLLGTLLSVTLNLRAYLRRRDRRRQPVVARN